MLRFLEYRPFLFIFKYYCKFKSIPMKKLLYLLVLIPSIIFQTLGQEIPEKEWKYHDDPTSIGWSEEKMGELRNYIIDSSSVNGMMIIQNGQVVFQFGDVVENSYIASCRKSVLALLYGKYVQNGKIDLSRTIEDMGITDVEGILPIEQKATTQHIISARSGVFHPEGYPGGMQQFAPKRGSVEPGTYWLYSNWDFNVAGYIFEEETGKNIYDEVQKQLAKPLKMQDWDRSLQHKDGNPSISKYLAYPMWFSTRDMARIGLLMLYEGR